jgi:hypothetical protein
LGKEVTTDSVSGEDVTGEFVDLQSRERYLLATLATAVLSVVAFGWWLALVAGLVWWRRRNRGSNPAATDV